MRVLILGATGMVGQGVLRECLRDPGVSEVVTLGRSATNQHHAKLREIVHGDLLNVAPIEPQLTGFDACFWCLGITSAGTSEADYTRITYDYTVAVGRALARLNPQMTFIFVSGRGTDSTEQSRIMWARVKGKAENAVFAMPFKRSFAFRPGALVPGDGIRSRTGWYNVLYAIMRPLYPLFLAFPNFATTTEQVGKAMLEVARHGHPKRILENGDIAAIRPTSTPET